MRPVHLYLLSVLAFGGVLFSINDVSASSLPLATVPPAVVAESIPDLSLPCTLPNGAGTVQAGQPFPKIVTCAGGGVDCGGVTAAGQYAQWDLTYNFTSLSTPRVALAEVAADVTIWGASPAAKVTTLGLEDQSNEVGENDFDSRWLEFSNVSQTNALVSYWTSPNVVARIEGVGERFGGSQKFCKYAGAGSRFGSAAEAVSLSTQVQAGPCTFTKTVDGRGCTTSLEVTSGNPGICVFSNETLALSNNPAFPLDPGTKCQDVQISFKGSCKYCYPTSSGALKCITDTSVASCPR